MNTYRARRDVEVYFYGTVVFMATKLHDWIEADVRPFEEKSVAWLSQYHFFRDPIRPTYSDLGRFFAPAETT